MNALQVSQKPAQAVVNIIENLHQTTTKDLTSIIGSVLNIIENLHQTTTP